jgi:hypothetical protein
MLKKVLILGLSVICGANSTFAESWLGVTGSGIASVQANSTSICSDASTSKGYSMGALWGADISKNFTIDIIGSYQKFFANRLNGYQTSPGSCERTDQDYLYANYRQEYLTLSFIPGYRYPFANGIALLFSVGGILNFNLGVKRDLVYHNKLSDNSMDGTILANTRDLPLDEKEHTQTDSLISGDLFTHIGFTARTSLVWQPDHSFFGTRLNVGIEKYASTGSSGVALLTSPVSSVIFRVSIDFLYRIK